MIKDLRNLSITSDYFGQNCQLDGILDYHLNLVFGMNGSGKSTIAQAISDMAKNLPIENTSAHISFNTELSEQEKKNIFVFNEKYLRDNIEIDSDGLDSIVTVGEDIDTNAEIQSLSNDIQKAEAKITANNIEFENISSKRAELESRVNQQLNGNQGYAARLRDSNNQQRKKAIDVSFIIAGKDSVSQKISSRTDTVEFGSMVNHMTQVLKEIAESGHIEATSIKKAHESLLPAMTTIKEEVLPLLSEIVEVPELSEREKWIVGLIEQGTPILKLSSVQVVNNSTAICPFCLQNVSESQKTLVGKSIERIERFLARNAEDFIQRMQTAIEKTKALFPTIEWDGISAERYNEYMEKVDFMYSLINEEIQTLLDLLKKRWENPYLPVDTFDFESLQSDVDIFDKAILSILSNIDDHNKFCEQEGTMRKTFDECNLWLSFLENKTEIIEILKLKKESDALLEQNKLLQESNDKNRRKLLLLYSKSNNTQAAMNDINSGLMYIYLTKDRLVLEPFLDEKTNIIKYKLLSHGRSVPPKNISEGERNAIGLTYFFASSFAQIKKQAKNNRTSFFVIDDPISSFDRGTRIGITSFLKSKFYDVFKNRNNASKILVFSHDLHTISDLGVVRNELSQDLWWHEEDMPLLELHNKCILPFKKYDTSYKQLLREAYDYAAADPNDDGHTDYAIGNDIRRLMETYSTFTYSIGTQKMLSNRMILNLIEDDRIRKFYARLSVMPFLNTDSHVTFGTDPIDPDSIMYMGFEKRMVVRFLLVFIYLTNGLHLQRCLYDSQEPDFIDKALDNIEEWIEELPILDEESDLSVVE